MPLYTIAFLCGIVMLQHFSYLPQKTWVGIILFFSIILFHINKKTKLIIITALGFAWALYFAHTRLAFNLSHDLEGKSIPVEGIISSIPDQSQLGYSFLLTVSKINNEPVNSTIRLTWQTKTEHLAPGQQWHFITRLKHIHSTLNPGGFDYEARALEDNIRARGYVVKTSENHLISNHWYHAPLTRMRHSLKNKIQKSLPITATSPWITALVIGERQGISQESWRVLRNTGTNHLMAIAGLHIGFMSGFIYFITSWCWRRSQYLTLHLPAPMIAAIAALATAIFYSALAGFSIPTQRACLMFSAFLLMTLLRRHPVSWYALSLALFLVLLLNPLSVLNESFWLSFGSVALIIYGVSGRVNPRGFWWKWGRVQWVIGIGLIPLSVWLFQQFSFTSFVANSIAIPVVGMVIVPLCLVGSFSLFFSEKAGGLILLFADKVLGWLWSILAYLSHLSWSSWYQVMPNNTVLVLACVGVILLLLPIGFKGRWFGVIGLMPLLLYKAPSPDFRNMWISLLDVGQGLSVVVRTKQHVLVFDTGAKLGANYDMGESVLVPFLRTVSVKKVDMLVVSHGDNDHIGGAGALMQAYRVSSIKTSAPQKFSQPNVSYCLRGEKWSWDGVGFEFLYPTQDTLQLNNDSSCVLQITDKNRTILLTGDIEKAAEKYLAQIDGEKLKSTILVAPHHGSKTSAVDAFLKSVNPTYVLFATGYRNRYHFPHKNVIEKYNALGVISYNTATAGTIEFTPALSLYRQHNLYYWRD